LKISNVFCNVLTAVGCTIAMLIILLIYVPSALCSLIGKYAEAREEIKGGGKE